MDSEEFIDPEEILKQSSPFIEGDNDGHLSPETIEEVFPFLFDDLRSSWTISTRFEVNKTISCSVFPNGDEYPRVSFKQKIVRRDADRQKILIEKPTSFTLQTEEGGTPMEFSDSEQDQLRAKIIIQEWLD